MEYNKYVEQWQQAVVARGAELGSAGVDGKFGPHTLKASLGIIEKDKDFGEELVKTAVCTANSYVNVRSGRGADYRKYEDIGNVYKGETVKVMDNDLSEEYVKIVWQDGVGYAYNSAGRYFRFVGEKDEKIDEKVAAFLEVVREIATPVDAENAKYIFGAEGGKITRRYVEARNRAYPEYFSNGRLELLLKIADECEKKGRWIYPIHHAWDCSGLWWYAANKVKLYGDRTVDSTAAGVYANYCIPITKNELRAGDIVFYRSASAGRITHMGIVGESGVVYEAMSGYTGIVTCDSVDDRMSVYLPGTHKAGHVFKRSAWTHFGRPMVFA
jgi:hypothetical protein